MDGTRIGLVAMMFVVAACGAAEGGAAPAESAGVGCQLKEMMCSSWQGLSAEQLQKATDECRAQGGAPLPECPAARRIATCSGAVSPSGGAMPDVHFYAGATDADTQGVLAAARKICGDSKGSLREATH